MSCIHERTISDFHKNNVYFDKYSTYFFKFQVVLKNKHASLTEFLLYKEGQSQNHLPIGIQKLHNILLKKTASVLIHYNSR